jgi:hypothetical protein
VTSKPEDLIQAAWVERSRQDIAAKRELRLSATQTTWPVWAPELAVQALRDAGWAPPACGCGPSADEREFAEVATKILDSEGALDDLIHEFYEQGGESPA